MKGIKETKELLEGLGLVAVAAKKIAADGRVSVDDLSHVMDLALQADKLSLAVQGAVEIPEEAKDLDQEEVLEIVNLLYKISGDINAV